MRRIFFFIIAALLTCQVYAQQVPDGGAPTAAPAPVAVPDAAAPSAQPAAPAASAQDASPAAPAANVTPAANSEATPSVNAAGASGTPKITMTPLGKSTGSSSPKPLKRADHNEKMPHAEHIIMLDASLRMQEAGYGNLQSGFIGAPALFTSLLNPDGKYLHSRDGVTIIPFSNLQSQAVDGHNALGNMKLSDLSKVLMSGKVLGPGKGELKGGLLKPLSRAFMQKKSGARFFWIFTKQDLNLEDKENQVFFTALRGSNAVSFVWYAPLGVMPGAKEKACLYLIGVNAFPERSPWIEGFIDTMNARLAKQVPGSQFIRLKVFAQSRSKQKSNKCVIPLMAYFFRNISGEGSVPPLMDNGRYVLELKPDGNHWKASLDFDIFYPDGWKFAKSDLEPKVGNGHTVAKNKKDSRLVKVQAEQTITDPDENGRAHVHWDIRVTDNAVQKYLLKSSEQKACDVKISLKDKKKLKYGSGEDGTFAPDASFLKEEGFEQLAKFMIFDDKGQDMSYSFICRPISLRLVVKDYRSPFSMLTLGGAVLVIASLVGFALGNKKKVTPASEQSGNAEASGTASADTPAEPAEAEPASGSSSEAEDSAETQSAEAGNASEVVSVSFADNAKIGNADPDESADDSQSAAEAASAQGTDDNSADSKPSE